MKEFSLSQRYAIIGLDGIGSIHPSMAKNAVLRAIAAAKVLEEVLFQEKDRHHFNLEQILRQGLKKVKDAGKKEQKKTGRGNGGNFKRGRCFGGSPGFTCLRYEL